MRSRRDRRMLRFAAQISAHNTLGGIRTTPRFERNRAKAQWKAEEREAQTCLVDGPQEGAAVEPQDRQGLGARAHPYGIERRTGLKHVSLWVSCWAESLLGLMVVEGVADKPVLTWSRGYWRRPLRAAYNTAVATATARVSSPFGRLPPTRGVRTDCSGKPKVMGPRQPHPAINADESTSRECNGSLSHARRSKAKRTHIREQVGMMREAFHKKPPPIRK